MIKVLTIAGSDSSGGAGIQADLKTMAAHGVYGMSVITALTAQNTTGVYGVFDVDPSFVAAQLDAVLSDLVPDAVKIGMVSNRNIIDVIVDKLREYHIKNIVVDPVMVSTSGGKLLSDEAMEAVITKLIPIADLITPNIPEAEALTQETISDADAMLRAAKTMEPMLVGAVLLKGGHRSDSCDDLLFHQGRFRWMKGERIDNPNTHGTGCTLSSAIACNLAAGSILEESVKKAKEYVNGALQAQLNLGRGRGPLDHMWGTCKRY